jgi:glutamyl-tRNA reductase
MVTNRTFARAEKLAEEFQGKPILFDNFADHLLQVDIILSSTGAPNFILGHKKMEEVIRLRKNKPMFLIDIAVPRDIEPKVNDIDNVYLYDVDDLQGVVQANLKERQKEAKKAEGIVDQEIGQFHRWLGTLDVVPTIVSLRGRMEEIRRGELEKTFSNLKDLDKRERKAIEALTGAIINKVLHQPMTVLKQSQNDPSGDNYVDAVRVLFGLEPPQPEEEIKRLDDELEEA